MREIIENCKTILDCKYKKQCRDHDRIPDKEISKYYVIPYGYVGQSYYRTRILILAQNPRITNENRRWLDDKFYLISSQVREASNPEDFIKVNNSLWDNVITKTEWPLHHAFRRLNLEEAFGVNWEDIAYSNVFKCKVYGNAFPADIHKLCTREVLKPQLAAWMPKFMIVVGKVAYGALGSISDAAVLRELLDRRRVVHILQPGRGEAGEVRKKEQNRLVQLAKERLAAFLRDDIPTKYLVSSSQLASSEKQDHEKVMASAKKTKLKPCPSSDNFETLAEKLIERGIERKSRKSGDEFWHLGERIIKIDSNEKMKGLIVIPTALQRVADKDDIEGGIVKAYRNTSAWGIRLTDNNLDLILKWVDRLLGM